MTRPGRHPAIRRLRDWPGARPLVAAHRGDSANHPENTLASFARATELGVAVQEFDVRQLADGTLVCVHDATFDRTTDSAHVLGPGALVAQCVRGQVERLDAGAWFGHASRGQRVPTLDQALDTMLPTTVPLIEHKAGEAPHYVERLQRRGCLDAVILQSFDWDFVAAARQVTDDLAVALLGPRHANERLDAATAAQAANLGAAMLHWHARAITAEGVQACHAAGLLLCSYTTDDELGWRGGRAMGLDIMCTNDPERMLAALR